MLFEHDRVFVLPGPLYHNGPIVWSCQALLYGNHVVVLPNTVIHHDTRIGDWSLIGSNVSVAGNTSIGDNCYIASGTTTIHALTDDLGGTAVTLAEPADVLVNCTPIGMDGDPASFRQFPLEVDEVSTFGCVVDLVYSHADTQLISAAKARRVPVVDGLELLVRQGALSFERFTGRVAPIDVMRAAAHTR